MVQRKTQRKRMVRKLKALRQEMKQRMHSSLRDQQQWLSSVLREYHAYYEITGICKPNCHGTTSPSRMQVRPLQLCHRDANGFAARVYDSLF